MKLLNNTLSTIIAASLLMVMPLAQAQTDEEKGLAISKESKLRGDGWGDMKSEMLMVLRNSQGQESLREVRLQSLELADDGDKSLSIFDKPLDVKGTAFLSFSHVEGADDQWLYLPALKRVKRIASRNKSGPFMGSEFSFEDLSSFEIEKYTYKYLRDEPCGEDTCFVVEQYPVDKNSGYKRRIVWLDQSEYRLQKIEFYDRKNSALKVLTYHDYTQYLDKFWRPGLMKMENLQSKKGTDLKWSNYEFKTGLSDKDFNKNTLKRAR